MQRVAILTDFKYFDSSYSLCLVAGNQIKMLTRAGYDLVFIACEGFEAEGPVESERVELRHIPDYGRSNYAELDDDWDEDIEKITKGLKTALRDIDVVLTHDLIFQAACLKLNLAARNVAAVRDGLFWLHWVHSATPPSFLSDSRAFLQTVQRKFPNSFVVYPNSYELPRVARAFGYEIDEVKCVPHPIDVCDYLGFHEYTRDLVRKHRILEADAVGVYPIRLDRGKQVEFCVRTFAQLKNMNRSVRLVVVDFHSTGGDKVDYRKELRNLGADLGLNESELIFTSDREETHLSCPREMVKDLMLLANVYIHPSVSETYSLTAQEAGLCGAFLVLNSDFPAMRSIYGPNAFYTGFSSGPHNVGSFWEQDVQREYSSNRPGVSGVDAFCRDIAGRVAYELDHNLVLAQQRDRRQNHNLDAVFREHLEPLLYAGV